MTTDSHPTRIGRYEIKSLIGAGGMGNLYLARDTNPNTDRLVALKLLNVSLNTADLRERFNREARALAALNHPNIVNIYDSGEFQGSTFIAMEYVRGKTLAELIGHRVPMSMAQKLQLMVELCGGLAAAHQAGIIHRDIKPANLMVDQRGHLKILDFGVARVESDLTRVGLRVSQVPVRIGTPGYMSPEQLEGGEVDRRSDIFSVGTVIYELISYTEAYPGANTAEIEDKVRRSRPAPLQSIVPGLDREIAAIVDLAIQRDPANRYQTADILRKALEQQLRRLTATEAETDRTEIVHRPTSAALRPPVPAPLPTPHLPDPRAPGPPASGPGSSRDRADAVYRRSQSAYQGGAHDAAGRFAMETLAEDPNHPGARSLIKQLDSKSTGSESSILHPSARRAAPTDVGPAADEPTIVVQRAPAKAVAAGAGRDVREDAGRYRVPAPPKAGMPLWSGFAPLWKRYGALAAIVAVILAAVGVAALIVGVSGWSWSSGRSLTITKPRGGTIVGPSILCGTRGNTCSATFTTEELVVLQAEPDSAYLLGEWTDDCARGGRTIMSRSRTCGATFNPVPTAPPKVLRLLTIVRPENGTIYLNAGEATIKCGTAGSDCTANIPEGTPIKLDAQPDAGYVVADFTGVCKPFGDTTMTEARTCGATFVHENVAVVRPGSAPPSMPRPGGSRSREGASAANPGGSPGVGSRGGPGGSGQATPSGLGASSGSGGAGAGGPGSGAAGQNAGAGAGGATANPSGGAPGPGAAPTQPGGSQSEVAEKVAMNAIQKCLNEWRDAYNKRDAEGVHRVYRGKTLESLQREFKDLKSVKYTLPPAEKKDYKVLDLQRGTATVDLDPVETKTVPKAGAPQENKGPAHFTLKRQGLDSDSWVIVLFQHEGR